MQRYTKSALPVPGVAVLVAIVIFTGWVMNIVKLSNCDFKAPYKAEVIHGVGVIPVVGMITGWMDLGD